MQLSSVAQSAGRIDAAQRGTDRQAARVGLEGKKFSVMLGSTRHLASARQCGSSVGWALASRARAGLVWHSVACR
jgi:hypothetical protein